mgnify:CR=1 FL=1
MTVLSEGQWHLVEFIDNNGPVGYRDIADEFSISVSTARDHVSDIRASQIPLEEGSDGQEKLFKITGEYAHPVEHSPDFSEQIRNKRAKSRKLTEHMNDMEQRLRRLLDESQPAVADDVPAVEPGHEDVVIHRTDTHFGDWKFDEFGNLAYDTDIAEERERTTSKRAISYINRQRDAGYRFDTVHYLLGGDIITGEATYRHQQAEVKETLDEQIDTAFDVHITEIERLSNEFPQVQVVCQPGNHGALEASYSNGANADRLLYMMLDEAVRRDPDLDNVTFIRNDSTVFTNFYVRGTRQQYEDAGTGWKFHLRHGDNSLEHIGTSSGKKRWLRWLNRHGFDQAYRGHYHKVELDTLHEDVKVIMTGSPAPPDEYEESLAEWSEPGATVHGVSDDETITWFKPISFDN